MAWSKLAFGKHKGKTLPQIVLTDPDWFFWAVEDNVFKGREEYLRKEAREIDVKARNIRIPPKEGKDLVVQYVIHKPTSAVCAMKIVPRSAEEYGEPVWGNEVIDLSYPRGHKSYDKLGCKLLLKSVKFHLFGNSKYRLTKAKCEEFFNNDNNFVLPSDLRSSAGSNVVQSTIPGLQVRKKSV